MNLLSPPWWLLPSVLFALPLGTALAFNRICRHRTGVSQHLVLGLFVSGCWLAAMILILQRVQ